MRSPIPFSGISETFFKSRKARLYPALHGMLIKGWVTAKWGTTAGNRRAQLLPI